MKHPSPALVTQDAVRRLPRALLILLSFAYILAGFVGRDPWKNDDMAAYGYMQALAQGKTSWSHPLLLDLPLEAGSALAVWLGAWSIKLAPSWFSPELASRIPSMLLIACSLFCIWQACYSLARSADAQPVRFAFGGDASPKDYARALADGAVLAMIASFGFAQYAHETSLHVVQLTGASIVFLAFAQGFLHPLKSAVLLAIGLALLLSSAAVHWALITATGAVLIVWWLGYSRIHQARQRGELGQFDTSSQAASQRTLQRWYVWPALATVLTLAAAVQTWQHELWAWSPHLLAHLSPANWRSLLRLFIWFSWPVWPLCLWSVWRWRKQIFTQNPSLHMLLPLWFSVAAAFIAIASAPADKTLFLGLPVFAVLAAFSLPTLKRSLAALIDWFTLLFFTVCGITIWVIWTATQTGFPAKPAANVAKLAPEYIPEFGPIAFTLALIATIAWLALVVWRTGRHQSALWKSLVLPAGGATWCLVLVTTLWLPMLNYARAYTVQIDKLQQVLPLSAKCVAAYDLSRPQIAAFQAQGHWNLTVPEDADNCHWALVGAGVIETLRPSLVSNGWRLRAKVERPRDDEPVFVFRRH